MEPDSKRELFRHLLATVAFRATIAISDAPDKFASFKIDETVRTPAEILAHLGDLIEGSHFLMKGEFVELKSEPLERVSRPSPHAVAATPSRLRIAFVSFAAVIVTLRAGVRLAEPARQRNRGRGGGFCQQPLSGETRCEFAT